MNSDSIETTQKWLNWANEIIIVLRVFVGAFGVFLLALGGALWLDSFQQEEMEKISAKIRKKGTIAAAELRLDVGENVHDSAVKLRKSFKPAIQATVQGLVLPRPVKSPSTELVAHTLSDFQNWCDRTFFKAREDNNITDLFIKRIEGLEQLHQTSKAYEVRIVHSKLLKDAQHYWRVPLPNSSSYDVFPIEENSNSDKVTIRNNALLDTADEQVVVVDLLHEEETTMPAGIAVHHLSSDDAKKQVYSKFPFYVSYGDGKIHKLTAEQLPLNFRLTQRRSANVSMVSTTVIQTWTPVGTETWYEYLPGQCFLTGEGESREPSEIKTRQYFSLFGDGLNSKRAGDRVFSNPEIRLVSGGKPIEFRAIEDCNLFLPQSNQNPDKALLKASMQKLAGSSSYPPPSDALISAPSIRMKRINDTLWINVEVPATVMKQYAAELLTVGIHVSLDHDGVFELPMIELQQAKQLFIDWLKPDCYLGTLPPPRDKLINDRSITAKLIVDSHTSQPIGWSVNIPKAIVNDYVSDLMSDPNVLDVLKGYRESKPVITDGKEAIFEVASWAGPALFEFKADVQELKDGAIQEKTLASQDLDAETDVVLSFPQDAITHRLIGKDYLGRSIDLIISEWQESDLLRLKERTIDQAAGVVNYKIHVNRVK